MSNLRHTLDIIHALQDAERCPRFYHETRPCDGMEGCRDRLRLAAEHILAHGLDSLRSEIVASVRASL